jgi:hypothetical protein
MEKDQKTTNSDKLIFEEVKERVKDQFDSVDSMDTKAGIALGFNGAILAALLNSNWFEILPIYFSGFILLVICVTTGIALKAFLVKAYKKDPDPSKLIEIYQIKTEKETRGQLIRNFEECFKNNQKMIEDKKKYLNWSFKLLALIVGVIALIALISIFTNDINNYSCWKIHK